MTIKVKFNGVLYIEGDNIGDIRHKWDTMRLFTPDARLCGACVSDISSIEDTATNKDVMMDWLTC